MTFGRDDFVFFIFVAVWALLSVASRIFDRKASLEARRTFHWLFPATSGVILVAAVSWLIRTWQISLIVSAAVAFMVWLHMRFTIFCPSCGKKTNTFFDRTGRGEPCRKCGKNL